MARFDHALYTEKSAARHAAALRREIARIKSRPAELARIVHEIGITDAGETIHQCMAAAVAQIALGNLALPMPGSDESPAACLTRIVDDAVLAQARYNVPQASAEETWEEDRARYADYVREPAANAPRAAA